MSTNTNTTRYTYANFATDIIEMLTTSAGNMPADKVALMLDKARALLAVQEKKAAYNADHKSAKTPKGASADTMTKANAIKTVLSDTPKTGAEINAELGTDYTALQIANAVKYIEGAKSCKVVRETVNIKGLKAQKEYTAYTLC